ncbi:hypothetical protein GA0115236_13845 [Streptomyces sp. IgraMP-1]|nr:hypothetical protein GA0115236_13845 [Streptomyces sp. IgraMP-1]
MCSWAAHAASCRVSEGSWASARATRSACPAPRPEAGAPGGPSPAKEYGTRAAMMRARSASASASATPERASPRTSRPVSSGTTTGPARNSARADGTSRRQIRYTVCRSAARTSWLTARCAQNASPGPRKRASAPCSADRAPSGDQ